MARSPAPSEERAKRVCVAQIGAAHGIRGEVRLRAFTADPAAVARYGPLESEDGGRRFEIVSLRPGKDHLIARLKGVADRNAAEALRNLRLYAAREQLPPPDDEEYYHADLIGLRAYGPDGRMLGTVAAVQNFGAGDLIEITPTEGRASVFVPFTKAVVPQVDIAGQRLVLDPPAGLFDEGEARRGEPD